MQARSCAIRVPEGGNDTVALSISSGAITGSLQRVGPHFWAGYQRRWPEPRPGFSHPSARRFRLTANRTPQRLCDPAIACSRTKRSTPRHSRAEGRGDRISPRSLRSFKIEAGCRNEYDSPFRQMTNQSFDTIRKWTDHKIISIGGCRNTAEDRSSARISTASQIPHAIVDTRCHSGVNTVYRKSVPAT
jgi:hypothetical protein